MDRIENGRIERLRKKFLKILIENNIPEAKIETLKNLIKILISNVKYCWVLEDRVRTGLFNGGRNDILLEVEHIRN